MFLPVEMIKGFIWDVLAQASNTFQTFRSGRQVQNDIFELIFFDENCVDSDFAECCSEGSY